MANWSTNIQTWGKISLHVFSSFSLHFYSCVDTCAAGCPGRDSTLLKCYSHATAVSADLIKLLTHIMLQLSSSTANSGSLTQFRNARTLKKTTPRLWAADAPPPHTDLTVPVCHSRTCKSPNSCNQILSSKFNRLTILRLGPAVGIGYSTRSEMALIHTLCTWK